MQPWDSWIAKSTQTLGQSLAPQMPPIGQPQKTLSFYRSQINPMTGRTEFVPSSMNEEEKQKFMSLMFSPEIISGR